MSLLRTQTRECYLQIPLSSMLLVVVVAAAAVPDAAPVAAPGAVAVYSVPE